MRKLFAWILALTFALQNCAPEKADETAERQMATEMTLAWNGLMLELERHTTGFRPPVSARTFAYIQMAAYEASLPNLEGYASLEHFLPGYSTAQPPIPAAQFYLPAALNIAYAQGLRDFFPTAPKNLKEKIDRLEAKHAHSFDKKIGIQKIEKSVAYGKAVSKAVWKWSATDAEGHDAFLFNYDRNYVPPVCAGCWQPDNTHPLPALLPNWGNTRAFVVQPEEVEIKAPIDFDETPGSAFHTGAVEVYSLSQPLSRENRWIAELWSDDLPGLTLTPAGRWIAITNQAMADARPPFPNVIETYLKVAMALCDAGILTWRGKYQYNLERPGSYIQRVINPDWSPLHENPPFPAYPSGHSAFGAAAAEVLSAQLGKKFSLTDRTHETRQEFVGKPRTYHSFEEMSQENAASRVLLGVHFRMDCEEGMRLGKIVGQRVAALPLEQKEAALLLLR